MMHLAAALKKEVIVLWEIPPCFWYVSLLRQFRYKMGFKEVQRLSCRPCSKLGMTLVPKATSTACCFKKKKFGRKIKIFIILLGTILAIKCYAIHESCKRNI